MELEAVIPLSLRILPSCELKHFPIYILSSLQCPLEEDRDGSYKFTLLKMEELRIRVWMSKQCHGEGTITEEPMSIVLSSCPSREGDLPKNPEVQFPTSRASASPGSSSCEHTQHKAKQGKRNQREAISLLQTVVKGLLLGREYWHPVIGALEKEPGSLPAEISSELGQEQNGREEGRGRTREDPQIMRKWPLTVFGGGDIAFTTPSSDGIPHSKFCYLLCSIAKATSPEISLFDLFLKPGLVGSE